MKKNNIFRRLVSLTVAIAMVMTIGTAVFAQNAGRLTLGQSYTQSNRNRSSRYYYTYTPSITGPYVLNARVANSNYKADIEVYTSVSGQSGNESFSGLIASFTVDTTSQQGANYDLNLTAGTTYYFRVRSNNINYTTTVTLKLNANYETTTISFYKNSTQASGSMSSVTVVRNQETTLPTCTFTRNGYTFLGWATNNSSTAPVVYEDGATITPTENTLTLYAKWAQTATIRFNRGQGASGTMSNLTVPAGQQTTLPTCTFTRSGYTFAGWSTSQYSTTVTYADGDPITPPAGTTNLYAVWTQVGTVTYNANGGTGTINPETVPVGTQINLPSSGYTKTNCNFLGWATSSSATTPDYGPGDPYTVTGNQTLYAVWENIYTISFNANGGWGTPSSQTGTSGAVITLPSSGCTRNNYVLIGWSESQNPGSSTTIYSLGGSYTITGSKTLYAVWGHRLSFNANGGTGSINPILARNGQSVILPGADAGITRNGATLGGWATSNTSTNPMAPGGEYTMGNQDRTLYAIWFYTLTFNANGGEGSVDPISRAYNSYVNLPSTEFTREGYGLRGWATTATATTYSYEPGARYQIRSAQTFYAVWGPQLSYDANGGEGAIATQTYANRATVNLKTASDGITRDGYTLLGWSTSASSTSPEYALGQRITITAPLKLYAIWGRNVAFAPNGGTGTIDPILAVPGTTITLPSSGFTRDGYTLAGWSIASDGTTKDYELGATYTVTNANVTLTAVWECTLSFDANGGTGDAMDDMTVIAGATVNLPACTYEYTTYSFAGWADTTTGTPSMTYTPSASTVMYAIWTARTVYNVNFDANGGEGTMASIPLTDDVTGTIPACEFTNTGFTFLGWSLNSAGETIDYVEGDPINVVDSDITLYAVWTARDIYYVNFNANGGEGSMSPLALTDDVTGTIPACGFTRDGYTCIGWSTDPDATSADYVEGSSISVVDSDIDLYAVWEEGTPEPGPGPEPEPEEPVYTPEQLREMNITHFVDRLYLVALGRAYDVDGRNNWANLLLVNGNSGSDIVYGFLNSDEFIGKNLSDEEYITILYRIFFDREPDAEGMANWKKALAGGATRNDILRGFADSPEWLAYCARYQVNP